MNGLQTYGRGALSGTPQFNHHTLIRLPINDRFTKNDSLVK
ncbi:hypothetical protein [Egbenema bharatensis]